MSVCVCTSDTPPAHPPRAVIFKGNLRGDPAVVYDKVAARLLVRETAAAPPQPPRRPPTRHAPPIKTNTQEEVGDQYRVYLLEDQDSKPVAVVLPLASVQPEVPAVPEAALAALFGACTLLTTLNINGAGEARAGRPACLPVCVHASRGQAGGGAGVPARHSHAAPACLVLPPLPPTAPPAPPTWTDMFNFLLLTFRFDPEATLAAVPGTLALAAILGVRGSVDAHLHACLVLPRSQCCWAVHLSSSCLPLAVPPLLSTHPPTLPPAAAHELGHLQAARQRGIELAPPLFVPAGLGLLGSFGAITRVKSAVPGREALAAVAAAGPLWGSAVSAGVMLVGLALTAQGVGGMEVAVDSFK